MTVDQLMKILCTAEPLARVVFLPWGADEDEVACGSHLQLRVAAGWGRAECVRDAVHRVDADAANTGAAHGGQSTR